MNERRAYLKSTTLVLAANFIVLAAAFLITPLIARVLRPDAYGLYALILRTGAALTAILLFSMHSALLYHVARRHEDGAFAGRALTTSLAFLLFTSLALAAPLYLLILHAAPSLGLWGFLAAYLLGFAFSLFYLVQSAQQALERFKAYSLVSAASAVVAGLVALGVAFLSGQAEAAGFARASLVLLAGFLSLLALPRLGPFDGPLFRSLWAYAKPLGLAGLAGMLLILADRYLLAAYHSNAQVGFFDISYTLATAVLPFTTSLLVTMAPRVIREGGRLDAYYRSLSAFSVVALSLFGLGLVVFSDIVIFFLLGSAYLPGALEPLRLVALALPLMAVHTLNVTVLPSLNRLRAASLLLVALVAGSITLNFALVPSLASAGAAYANLGTHLLVAAAGVLYLRSRYHVSVRHTLEQLVLFALFAALFQFYVHSMGFLAKVVLWLAFAALTYLLHRRLVHEILDELLAALRARLTPPAGL